jgi:RimJ/RimL family protein N-acetyltransferase
VRAFIPESKFHGSGSKSFCLEKSQGNTFWVICIKDNGKMVGHVFLSKEFNPDFLIYEIGYMLNPKYQGKGYATEACHRILQYGFEDIKAHRIIATCDPGNIASWRLLERLNMRREAHFVKCLYLRKPTENNPIGWRDEYFYAILNSEYRR